jgi:hypothetical protein
MTPSVLARGSPSHISVTVAPEVLADEVDPLLLGLAFKPGRRTPIAEVSYT